MNILELQEMAPSDADQNAVVAAGTGWTTITTTITVTTTTGA
ncbi:hypothetical protein OG562_05290 [Streptomyces sp. NBC_01275]|nr:hypothetical protein [Streptomyces sp. NBC_01275]MCX4760397.1 hypothetical protein [Streptomyces sp. NBC_01275]